MLRNRRLIKGFWKSVILERKLTLALTVTAYVGLTKHACTCMHERMSVCEHVFMCIYLVVYTYVFMYVCMYDCMYVL